MKKDFVKRTLKNGIPVYLYKDKNLKRVVMSYNVKYVSGGEFSEFYYKGEHHSVHPGMAHFLEHYLIEHAKGGNMIHVYTDRNHSFNGLTYDDMTIYYFIAIKNVKEAIKDLISFVDDPVFTEENIESVKHAIVDEVRKNFDKKYMIAHGMHSRNLYKNFEKCPKHGNHLGTKNTTLAITKEEAELCYNAYYNNENKFIVIGGNIDIDECMEYLNSIMDEMPKHENYYSEAISDKLMPVRRKYSTIEMPIDNDYLIVSYKMEHIFKDIDPLLLDLYFYLYFNLKFMNSNEFISGLIKDKVIIGGVNSSHYIFKDTIIISFATDVIDEKEFIRRLEEELSTSKIDESMFELLIKSLVANELSRMDNIYSNIRRFPLSIDLTEKLNNVDTLKKCSLDELKEVISKFKFDNRVVTYVKSNLEKE